MDTLKWFEPTRTEPWDQRRARHLLERAGWGGTPAEVAEVVRLGPRDAVAKLLDYPPTAIAEAPFVPPAIDGAKLRGLSQQERKKQIKALQKQARRGVAELKGWWLRQMVSTPHPLSEKLALFWHGHFTSESSKVKNPTALFEQNNLFRRLGKGRFRDLVLAVSQDPAMLLYLDNHLNRKGHPNENYARELMELFTLGIGNYTEKDVLEAARAFTGWTIRRGRGGRTGEMTFELREAWHDSGQKTVLGRTGNLGGAEVIDQLLTQLVAARFLCGKLWRFFVSDDLDPADEPTLAALAEEYRAADYTLEPLLRTLLNSRAFYQEQRLGGRIKSPVELLVGTLRRFQVTPDERQGAYLALVLRSLGQDLFDPPNVAGWPGGRSWINTSTLLARYNVMHLLLSGGQVAAGRKPGRGRPQAVGAVAAPTLPAGAQPAQFVAAMVEQHLATPLPEPQQREVEQYLEGLLLQRTPPEAAWLSALHLVLSTPQYQVC